MLKFRITVCLLMLVYGLSAKDESARMMVHLLDYIAVDYSMAVEDGEIISMAEYQEMKEFAKTVNELGSDAPATAQSDIILLMRLIDDKASQEKISSVAAGIKHKVIEHFHLEVAPKRWPSIENGKELYSMHCVSCHGETGFGDGPLAEALDPRPTNFHAPDKANGLSPFQAYNTTRLGVENTGMRAFNELSDDEIWDLAFYILSLPQQTKDIDPKNLPSEVSDQIDLKLLASKNNVELKTILDPNNELDMLIPAVRLHPKEIAGHGENYLDKAISLLQKSVSTYREGNAKEARDFALIAYLEGVEPIEVQLRANDPSFVAELEKAMAEMRSAIERDKDISVVEKYADKSIDLIRDAQEMLSEQSFSAWMTFLLSSTIVLREGLEAFLVILTILSIIRSLRIQRAENWIHAGWISAISLGVLLWVAADQLFTFSGTQREVMEGAIALFAVGVLLYVGFWMHSKSEAGKWQKYVKDRIKNLARKENMLGLAFLSFLVVFREAFETVLFLSALNLEVGQTHSTAFGGGIIIAFIVLAILSVLLLRYSKKIPITKLFKYSSIIIAVLAVILMGKGVHSIQEAGVLNISTLPLNLRFPLIGLYPTWETFLSQVAMIILIAFLWKLGNKPLEDREKVAA